MQNPQCYWLATNAALTAAENKTSDINSLVKKRIMMEKYQALILNILLQLFTINFQK